LGQLGQERAEREKIETLRLLLREPTEKDIELFHQLRQDEQVRTYLGGPVSRQVAEAKASVNLQQWRYLGYGEWVVCERESGEVCGLCGLSPHEESVELSYMFMPKFWGRGLASEAARAILEHGFHVRGFERIVAITQEANQRSWSLLERLGMRHTHSFWCWEAEQRFYEIVAEDYDR
jgi:ribosomal-protein-alanine N-acetyltransferase